MVAISQKIARKPVHEPQEQRVSQCYRPSRTDAKDQRGVDVRRCVDLGYRTSDIRATPEQSLSARCQKFKRRRAKIPEASDLLPPPTNQLVRYVDAHSCRPTCYAHRRSIHANAWCPYRKHCPQREFNLIRIFVTTMGERARWLMTFFCCLRQNMPFSYTNKKTFAIKLGLFPSQRIRWNTID